jgi:type IV secretory pathway VirB9-like protein
VVVCFFLYWWNCWSSVNNSTNINKTTISHLKPLNIKKDPIIIYRWKSRSWISYYLFKNYCSFLNHFDKQVWNNIRKENWKG